MVARSALARRPVAGAEDERQGSTERTLELGDARRAVLRYDDDTLAIGQVGGRLPGEEAVVADLDEAAQRALVAHSVASRRAACHRRCGVASMGGRAGGNSST